MSWNRHQVIVERLYRQGLAEPLTDEQNEENYVTLFRKLQPVAPVYFSRPGDPPKLVHRTLFDDRGMSFSLRERQRLIKGRFQGGRIGYVLEEDLMLYATAFRKQPKAYKQIHEDIMVAIKESGGLSKDQLKEELSNYSSGEVGKALQDLQHAFLLYEQQMDTDWDTGWLVFAEEWFELSEDPESKEQCMMKVLLLFVDAMVFATEGNIKSWSGWPSKTIRHMVSRLIEHNELVVVEIGDMGKGVIRSTDFNRADTITTEQRHKRGIWMLDKSDFLVRAALEDLQSRYKGMEVLQYLLVDGEFQGGVLGHWRIGPYDVEDIVLDLDLAEAEERKAEVIAAVRKVYDPEYHAILRYNGMPVDELTIK